MWLFSSRQAAETLTARFRASPKQSEPDAMRGGLPCFASSFLATWFRVVVGIRSTVRLQIESCDSFPTFSSPFDFSGGNKSCYPFPGRVEKCNLLPGSRARSQRSLPLLRSEKFPQGVLGFRWFDGFQQGIEGRTKARHFFIRVFTCSFSQALLSDYCNMPAA